MIKRSSIGFPLIILSGCAILTQTPPEPEVVPEPDPIPLPAPMPEPEIVPEPVVEEPPYVPPPVVPEEPQHIEPLVAVIISDRNPAYVSVADALGDFLDSHEVYDLSDRSLSPESAFAAIADSGAKAVVAIGLPAATSAREFSSLPVVVSQVFNLKSSGLLSANMKAVSALPPLGLQIDEWLALDPELENVGAILGPGHEFLLAEAEQAMNERGIKFHFATAESDRQTLYLFNRLVRDLDGFLLFPDNRVLSRGVLSEMMKYASQNRVQVAVFNAPLLAHGATLNAGTVPENIAAKITGVLEGILSGEIDQVPPVTSLSEIDISTNENMLRKFGLFTQVEYRVAGSQ